MKRWTGPARAAPLVLALLLLSGSCAFGESDASDAQASPHTSVPSSAAPPTTPKLPPPHVGGPTRGVPQALDRVNAQLPKLAPYVQATGAGAVDYYEEVSSVLSGEAAVFEDLSFAAGCAGRFGLVATKVYISPDFSEAVGVVVLSDRNAAESPAQIPPRCFLTHASPVGSAVNVDPGPSGHCLMKYYYDALSHGTLDRYFVLVGGTYPALCDLVLDQHARFDPHPFDVA